MASSALISEDASCATDFDISEIGVAPEEEEEEMEYIELRKETTILLIVGLGEQKRILTRKIALGVKSAASGLPNAF